MFRNLKPIISIIIIILIYRIITFGYNAWIPYNLMSLASCLSDIAAFIIVYFIMQFFATKSFKKRPHWWVTLLISLAPAIIIAVLFRALLLIMAFS